MKATGQDTNLSASVGKQTAGSNWKAEMFKGKLLKWEFSDGHNGKPPKFFWVEWSIINALKVQTVTQNKYPITFLEKKILLATEQEASEAVNLANLDHAATEVATEAATEVATEVASTSGDFQGGEVEKSNEDEGEQVQCASQDEIGKKGSAEGNGKEAEGETGLIRYVGEYTTRRRLSDLQCAHV